VGARDEEVHSVLPREGRNRVHTLALQAKALATRDDDLWARDVAEPGNLVRDAWQQVLGVVEDEQRAPPLEPGGDALREVHSRQLLGRKRLGQRGRHMVS
jgi:hypothetical protein